MMYDLDNGRGMEQAIMWMETILLMAVRQGGVRAVPRSGIVYEIDHERKVAKKLSGDPEPTIQRVFEEMGWTVDVE